MLIFIVNVVYSMIFVRVPAEANPWRSKSIEWQLPTPVPVHNFEQIPTSTPIPTPTARRCRAAAAQPATAGA